MISMEIMLDNDKIQESNYTEAQLWEMIHNVMTADSIEIKTTGQYENESMGKFAMVIEDLIYNANWFRPIVKKWTWNVNGTVENLLEVF
ncbi:MAG: hypothetical protein IKY94_07025 [Lachnospiraceae bacterium]|nr:hypothetical protein [Lachnospiraceae bacterium]